MHIVLVYGFAHKGHHQGQERTDRKFNSSSSSLSVPKLPVSLLHKGTDGFISFRPPVCRVSLRQQSPGCGERQLPGPSRLQAALPVALLQWGVCSPTAMDAPPSAFGDPQGAALILALTALLAPGEGSAVQTQAAGSQWQSPNNSKPLVRSADRNSTRTQPGAAFELMGAGRALAGGA